MELKPVAAWLAEPCPRCGQPNRAHGVRPFTLLKLPGVRGLQAICPTDPGTVPAAATAERGRFGPLQAQHRTGGGDL